MLLIDDSDNYCLYSDSERDEFLFRIFFHICLGGRFNQYEDELQPYLDVTKQVYKDLIRYVYFACVTCIYIYLFYKYQN